MGRKRTEDLPPRIRRGRYQEIVLYEISEAELDELERGSPDSILLNFSILFLSVFASFLAALLTASFPSDRAFLVFVVITVVSGAAGIVLLVLWFRSRRRVATLVRAIRDRLIPDEGLQEPTEIVRRTDDSPRADDPGIDR